MFSSHRQLLYNPHSVVNGENCEEQEAWEQSDLVTVQQVGRIVGNGTEPPAHQMPRETRHQTRCVACLITHETNTIRTSCCSRVTGMSEGPGKHLSLALSLSPSLYISPFQSRTLTHSHTLTLSGALSQPHSAGENTSP